MSTTHYPESMSGPRERKVAIDCSTCHIVESQIECKNCLDVICLDCAVRCGDCGTGPLCIPCAIKNGYENIVGGKGLALPPLNADGEIPHADIFDDRWACENCAPAYECELEEARR